MTRLVRLARIVIVAFLLYAAWPVLSAGLRGDIGWSEAIDAFITDRTAGLILLFALVCLVLSLLRNGALRVLVSAGVLVLVFLVVTGQMSVSGLRDSVDRQREAVALGEAAKACGYDLSVERFGEGLRTVLKTRDGAEATIGYVGQRLGDGFKAVIDENGMPREVICP